MSGDDAVYVMCMDAKLRWQRVFYFGTEVGLGGQGTRKLVTRKSVTAKLPFPNETAEGNVAL